MKRYVIIGNGAAAAGCIEGVRSVDPEGPVTVVSQEPQDCTAVASLASRRASRETAEARRRAQSRPQAREGRA